MLLAVGSVVSTRMVQQLKMSLMMRELVLSLDKLKMPNGNVTQFKFSLGCAYAIREVFFGSYVKAV